MSAIYQRADLYDLAFSYRDVAHDVSSLLSIAERAGVRVERALELAAGPAHHAIELASRGVATTALDLAPAMCDRARNAARERGVTLDVREGDMTRFVLPAPVDLAFCLLTSLSHLHETHELVAHFASVKRAMSPHGVYIVELTHPRDFVGVTRVASAPWTVEREGLVLRAQWGKAGDPYDAVRQIYRASARLELDGTVLEETVAMRDWTKGELELAAKCVGMTPVAWYGDPEGSIALDHEDAWRMVAVLR